MQDKEIREQKAKVSRKWYLLFSGILLLLAFGPYVGVVHLTTIDRLTPAVLGVAIILG
jgi:hypothetical protein